MNGKLLSILMIGGALLAAAAAVFLTNRYIEGTVSAKAAELQSGVEPVKVIVANADLRPGTLLSSQTVSIREIPKAYLSGDAVPAEAWSSISGRVLSLPVRSGEPILAAYLAHELGAGFSAQLKPGQRALTFPVDDESSIAGLLQPGDRIDLLFTTTAGNESVTVPLLYGVAVIATGVHTITNAGQLSDEARRANYTTVTVGVSLDEAARIAFAQQSGKVTVTLRQQEDKIPVQLARITKQSLLRPEEKLAVTGVRRPPVEIIFGRK